ncbi:queuosine precursor transporter [Bradyrhizobium sp. DASA03005]|uniref:queuosine precursor transporter n=1 Tax=Bradyrhizobium sp. SPXBL-02 TaxID=3395912 RepID=UPI003F70FD6F
MMSFRADKPDAQLKYFWPIVLAYVTFQLISDVTAGKVTALGPAQFSVTVLYFPVTYVISDVLTEVYGYARARRVLWLVMASSVTAGLVYQLVVVLPPAEGFPSNAAYETVFGQVPRILVAGWIAVFAGDLANNYVLAKMKLWTKGKYLWTRTVGSTLVGQFFNTTIFYVGALSSVLPTNALLQAIFWGWAAKVAVEVMFTPLTYWIVSFLKKSEGIDYFDYDTDFTPLRY